MATPSGDDPKQVFLEGPKAEAMNSDSVLLDKKRDRPIEKDPPFDNRRRVPKDTWLSNGPPEAVPPAVKYVFRNNGKDQTWESVAAEIGKSPEWLIWYNFKLPSPIDPSVVNWFLREYVGATVPTFDRKNWTFENTTAGFVWVPQARSESEASALQACEHLLGAMKELERSFPVDPGRTGEERYYANKPYISALKGYADTIHAELFPGDYLAQTGSDVLEAPPEFPVPPGKVDVTRYRPQGYGVGFAAAIKAWDALTKTAWIQLRTTMAVDCRNRLYDFANAEIQRLMGTGTTLTPGYPPPPARD
jgi:hypothetical protein